MTSKAAVHDPAGDGSIVRVVVADDHQVVRQGLRTLLQRANFDVVGEAADGREAVRVTRELLPDVVVLDLVMPLLNGIEAAREIVRTCPETRAILLTGHDPEPYVLETLRAGVRGFVVKTQAVDDLVMAIGSVVRGEIYLSPDVVRTLVEQYLALTKDRSPEPRLSARERQMLQLVAEGKTTKEAAAHLGVSYKTAESHRARLMKKLDVHDTAGLVRHAIRMGLIQP